MSNILWEGEVYTVWFWKWKRAMPEWERHISEKAVENAVMGTLVCMAQIPLAQWQEMSSLRRGWGQGRLQFIAHSEIKISPN